MSKPKHSWMVWAALAGVPAYAACNMVTGADDVRFGDDDDDGSSSTGATAGVGGGVGGGATQAAATTGMGGATTSNTVAAATTGSGGAPTNCEYPVGPYSVAQGGTVPPTLSWQGFVPNSNTPSTISMQDLFDCDGSRGIDAIVIDTSQYG